MAVRECTERAASLDDAGAKAFAEARKYLISGGSIQFFPGTKVFSPQKQVDFALIQDPFSAAAITDSFLAAAHKEKNWVFTVRYFRTFRMILDEDFELKKWELVE